MGVLEEDGVADLGTHTVGQDASREQARRNAAHIKNKARFRKG